MGTGVGGWIRGGDLQQVLVLLRAATVTPLDVRTNWIRFHFSLFAATIPHTLQPETKADVTQVYNTYLKLASISSAKACTL